MANTVELKRKSYASNIQYHRIYIAIPRCKNSGIVKKYWPKKYKIPAGKIINPVTLQVLGEKVKDL